MNTKELISKFKKNNKEARETLAKRLGFADAQSYIEFLSKSTDATSITGIVKVPFKKIPTIHNVYIIDASGSMAGAKIKSAISGINSEIEELAKVKGVNYRQTIVSFSGQNDIVVKYLGVPIGEMTKYQDKARDMTALLDAIGYTFARVNTIKEPDDKVLVKIFTDGNNNDSSRESWKSISKKIKDLEKEGYTITFVGTEHDTKKVVERLKIDESNTLIHDNTGQGVLDSFAASTIATANYSSKVLKGQDVTKGFYKKVGKL